MIDFSSIYGLTNREEDNVRRSETSAHNTVCHSDYINSIYLRNDFFYYLFIHIPNPTPSACAFFNVFSTSAYVIL